MGAFARRMMSLSKNTHPIFLDPFAAPLLPSPEHEFRTLRSDGPGYRLAFRKYPNSHHPSCIYITSRSSQGPESRERQAGSHQFLSPASALHLIGASLHLLVYFHKPVSEKEPYDRKRDGKGRQRPQQSNGREDGRGGDRSFVAQEVGACDGCSG